MFQLGFVSAILGNKTFEEVIDFASENKFKCVEIMCWPQGKDERRYAGVTHIDAANLTPVRAKEILDYCKSKNVAISALGYYPNPLDGDENKATVFIEHIKNVIKASALLGLPVINTFIGRDHTKNIEDNMALFRKRWPSIIDVAKDYNIKIGIENCPMLFTNDEWPGGKNLMTTPTIWRRIFDEIPGDTLGLNFDPSHFIWQMMDYIQPMYDFKDRIYHVHLKDAKLYPEKLNQHGIMGYPLQYHSPKLPGLGDVNWRNFFTALTDIGYRGPICIEVEDKAYEKTEEDINAAILTSRNYINQFLP